MINFDWKGYYSLFNRSKIKYSFYDGCFDYNDPQKSKIANKLPKAHVGWGARAIEARANKTHFDRFENDTLGLNEVIEEYELKEAFNSIKDDILVCGVGFLALNRDRVVPFTAEEATGTYDWNTQNLKNGVAVFQRSTKKDSFAQTPSPDAFIYFDKDETVICQDDEIEVTPNKTKRPLIAALTHRATTKQPFGRTVLNRAARDAMVDASRTIRQAMIAAYHYNAKVDVILGVDSETEVDVINSQTGDVLKVGPNENGQIPQIGEFAQHAMAPFNDSILISARNFCAATKLNVDSLGISNTAPQSPEALEIMNDALQDDINSWQKELGKQIKHFAVTLFMHKYGITEIDENMKKQINQTEPVWLPVYQSDVGKFGDGLNKLAMNAPGIAKQRSVWRSLGLTSKEIDDVISTVRTDNSLL